VKQNSLGQRVQTNKMFLDNDRLIEKEVDAICDYVDLAGLDCEEWEVNRTNLVLRPVTDCVMSSDRLCY
jgi:hypothetical protein